MLCRMTWADETAGVSPLNAHLEWPSAEDDEAESSEDGPPAARQFFLGQLSGDQPDGVWEDEQPGGDNGGDRPADLPDEASDLEGFELPAWTGAAELEQALPEDAPHLDLIPPSDTGLPSPATSDADDDERPLASAADDPTTVATCSVPLAGEQETDGVALEQRTRLRSRIAIAAAVVVVLVIGTAVYVGTRAKAEDQRGHRPTSTSVESQSTSTTGAATTTASSSAAVPDTEPAPASSAASGSAGPASRQGAPKSTGSSQIRAPGTGTSGASSPPPAASSGPNASPPPAPMPPPSTRPNPVCQVTPQLCP